MTAVQPGLCGACLHARIIETRTGSRFFLCELAASDPRYLRYPRLPVLRCAGFQPAPPAQAAAANRPKPEK